LIIQGAQTGRRERKKRERRDQIVACAVEAFDRLGFDGASVEAIAEAADVSLRTLYNFFPTKLDLLLAGSVRTMRRQLETQLSKLDDPPPALDDGLYKWHQAHIRIYAAMDRDLLVRSALHGVAQGPRRGGGQDYAEIDRFSQSVLRRMLNIYATRGDLPPQVDLDDLARLIFAVGNGEFFVWIANPDQSVEMTLRHMRNHINLLLSGVLPRDSAHKKQERRIVRRGARWNAKSVQRGTA
jgi:AcrR family transcriptional regulator